MVYLTSVLRMSVHAAPAVPSDLAYVGPLVSTGGTTHSETTQVISATTDTQEFAPNGPLPSMTAPPPPTRVSFTTSSLVTPPRDPPIITAVAGAPSYVIARPSIVTLQIIDGQLVQASEAPTRYSLALPQPSGSSDDPIIDPSAALRVSTSPLGKEQQDASPLEDPPEYVNPLVQGSHEIIASMPTNCTRACAPFRNHCTSCASRHPPIRYTNSLTPAENITNVALSECLCDYTYQAQTCGQCFIAQGGKGGAVRGLVQGCQMLREGKLEALVSFRLSRSLLENGFVMMMIIWGIGVDEFGEW